MPRKLLKWTRRLVVLGVVAAAIARILESTTPSDGAGDRRLPSIGGDTWPPVPVNPNRTD
jgi:hypothetical protein